MTLLRGRFDGEEPHEADGRATGGLAEVAATIRRGGEVATVLVEPIQVDRLAAALAPPHLHESNVGATGSESPDHYVSCPEERDVPAVLFVLFLIAIATFTTN